MHALANIEIIRFNCLKYLELLMKRILTILFTAYIACGSLSAQTTGFSSVEPLSKNATLLYGNGLAVRLQEHGYFEALLQLADADNALQIRSLSYTGDQVHYRLRPAKFGAHLNKILSIWKGSDLLLFFGQNESFGGADRLEEFESNLNEFLGVLQSRHPDAKITIISPIAAENLNDSSLPDATERNRVLSQYTTAMKTLATSAGIGFVDLFAATKVLYAKEKAPLTLDGLYLNDHGNFLVGLALAQALRPDADFSNINFESPWFKQLVRTVKQKVHHVAETYRPSNGVHYYSVRARGYEYEAEVPHHMNLANQLDRRLWRLASQPGSVLEAVELPTNAAEPPSKGGRHGTGTLKTVKEDLKDFEVTDGYSLTCFASNEDFDDLINPMQVHAGPRGRIWVATFESYPIPVPGVTPNDKILILEDTNGDGKADKRTVFADHLLLPDGFVFYRDGIVVSVPRKLIWLRDTDGDDRADTTIEMLCGIDDTDTHHGGFLATTPNGRITICEGVFHRTQIETPWGVVHSKDATAMNFDPRTRRVTVERQTRAPNPWKVTHNSWGETYQMFGGGQTIDGDVYTVGLPAGAKPMDIGGLFRHDKGCAMAAVSSGHFPAEWQDGTVTGHLLGRNTVIFTPLKLSDGKYAQEGKEIELMKSSNKSFRPVDLCFGLDGALYVSDLYYPIIGHAQHSVRDKNRDYRNGRIWRLTRNGAPTLTAPKITGASVEALLNLLVHDQVRVRELTRVELGKYDNSMVIKAMKNWLPSPSDESLVAQRKRLEALWIHERRGIANMALIRETLTAKEARVRAAGARSLRYWHDALGTEKLTPLAREALADSHPRVRIGAISSMSFLQWKDPIWHTLLLEHKEQDRSPAAAVLAQAKTPPEPIMKPVVPILAALEASRLKEWNTEGTEGTIWFKANRAQEVRIGSRRNASIQVFLNDLPIIEGSGNQFSQDFQAPAKIRKGYNKISYVGGPPPKTKKGRKPRGPVVEIYLSDTKGEKPRGVTYPKNIEESRSWAKAYAATFATVGENHIYLKAVPGRLQFNAKELVVKAGKTYQFTLENPDIIMHNFILCAPGTDKEIGALADALAATPDGLKKHYIPESKHVLFATEQVASGNALKVEFKTPKTPGEYPYICSFPGHWHIMRGVMTVKK